MKANRVKKVAIHLKQDEYEDFIKAYKGTICRSISDYGRNLLLSKPVTVVYRNRSIDDFTETAVKLRKELKILLEKTTLTPTETEWLKHKIVSIEENLIKVTTL